MTVAVSSRLFVSAFCVYLVAMVCYIAHLVMRRGLLGRVGMALLVVGLGLNTASLVVRTIVTGHPPLLNLYEYMLSLTWSGVVVYLVLEWVTRTKVFGAFAVPLISISAYIAIRLPVEAQPIPVALKSIWRVPHIGTATLAYAAFGMAFCMAIMYIIRGETDKPSFWSTRLPTQRVLDSTMYRTIAFGFVMQTLLILTGALWAQESWARYWGWDHKETWSLITWLVYAVYLHTRVAVGWKGWKSVILAMVGFAVAMFTLFGVNLLGGLHSYAG